MRERPSLFRPFPDVAYAREETRLEHAEIARNTICGARRRRMTRARPNNMSLVSRSRRTGTARDARKAFDRKYPTCGAHSPPRWAPLPLGTASAAHDSHQNTCRAHTLSLWLPACGFFTVPLRRHRALQVRTSASLDRPPIAYFPASPPERTPHASLASSSISAYTAVRATLAPDRGMQKQGLHLAEKRRTCHACTRPIGRTG